VSAPKRLDRPRSSRNASNLALMPGPGAYRFLNRLVSSRFSTQREPTTGFKSARREKVAGRAAKNGIPLRSMTRIGIRSTPDDRHTANNRPKNRSTEFDQHAASNQPSQHGRLELLGVLPRLPGTTCRTVQSSSSSNLRSASAFGEESLVTGARSPDSLATGPIGVGRLVDRTNGRRDGPAIILSSASTMALLSYDVFRRLRLRPSAAGGRCSLESWEADAMIPFAWPPGLSNWSLRQLVQSVFREHRAPPRSKIPKSTYGRTAQQRAPSANPGGAWYRS